MIATASPTIKVPFGDYQEVVKILLKDKRLKYDKQLIKSAEECESLNLQNLVLHLSGIKLSIPPFLYTAKIENDHNFKCLILIEQNNENTSEQDSIITEEDGPDYISSDGYILGAPVLQSFIVLLDFDKNKVGFAQKVNSFGSYISQGKMNPNDQG